MLRVFLTHTPEMRGGYYADAPLAALRQVAEVTLHTGDAPLSGAALAEAAAGCHCIVADRATAGTAETFTSAPDLLAFCAWPSISPPSTCPRPLQPGCW